MTALLRAGTARRCWPPPTRARCFALGAGPRRAAGTFTSKVKDTETVSSWGRLRWEATLPDGRRVEVQTRSGNTGTPDTTWSDWSAPTRDRDGDAITSERARFLQVKAMLGGQDGAHARARFLQRGLPAAQPAAAGAASPSIRPGEVFQKPLSVTRRVEILGLEPAPGPPRPPGRPARLRDAAGHRPTAASCTRRGLQTFSWKADDPNGDTLSYDVHYRAAEDSRFRLLRKGLTDAVLAWDTSTVPNGRYVVRVTATRRPVEPRRPGALRGRQGEHRLRRRQHAAHGDGQPPGERAPRASARRGQGRQQPRAQGRVLRGRRALGGDPPIDGINDGREETYEFAPAGPGRPGPHVVVVRATDLLGNVATARVEVP